MNLAPRLAIALLATPALAGQTQVFDLSADWSIEHNPFGAWQLLKSPSALFTICQTDYTNDGRNIPAWADEQFPRQAHVPVWSRTVYPSDQFRLGEITVHGAELDRTGSDFTAAVWTAPAHGVATIEGRVWAPTMLGRTQHWTLTRNLAALSSATLTSDGTWMHDTPMSLASGSGGPSVLIQTVDTGDRIAFELRSISESGNLGDSWGIHLSIRLDSCPADFNTDGTVDFFDYLDFAAAFDAEDPTADINTDGSIDFFDYLDFVARLDAGC